MIQFTEKLVPIIMARTIETETANKSNNFEMEFSPNGRIKPNRLLSLFLLWAQAGCLSF
jgi:hypothetical protein